MFLACLNDDCPSWILIAIPYYCSCIWTNYKPFSGLFFISNRKILEKISLQLRLQLWVWNLSRWAKPYIIIIGDFAHFKTHQCFFLYCHTFFLSAFYNFYNFQASNTISLLYFTLHYLVYICDYSINLSIIITFSMYILQQERSW